MHRSGTRFSSIVGEIEAFFGQDHYRSLGPAIAARKPAFRLVFLCAGISAGTRLGACLLILSAYLFYPRLRQPLRPACIFEFGLSANNERSFRRLNGIMNGERWDAEMNQAAIPFVRRLRCLSVTQCWQAGAALHEMRTDNPFVTTQQALACAALMLFDACLSRVRPSLVVVANDHSPTCVALRHSAQERRLPVVYIQHAPVNRYFPPLRFDLSILHDDASRDDYRASARARGMAQAPVVTLSPFDRPFRLPRVRRFPLRVGICESLVTDRDAIAALAGELAGLPQVSAIQLRRHPRSREPARNNRFGGAVSVRPMAESLHGFLGQVDLVLAPNSGVCVECLHHGKPTFHIPGADMLADDHYGFVAGGILPEFDIALMDSLEALNAPFDALWRTRFSRYDATESLGIREMEAGVRRAVGEMLGQGRAA